MSQQHLFNGVEHIFTLSSTARHVGFHFVGFTVELLSVDMCFMAVFEFVFSFPRGLYSGVKLLDCR